MPPASFQRPGSGTFSCFHGEKEKRPPLDAHVLAGGFHVTHPIHRLYDKAARRLPLSEIPDLAACVSAAGHCIGLADPVTNIVLNAVALMRHKEKQPTAPNPFGGGGGWPQQFALNSDLGQQAFMTCYFRYLGRTQARRYLHLASDDLALAIRLVRHDRLPPRQQCCPLLPDGGRLRYALGAAAREAGHPAPDVLAGIMTAEYPAALLSPVLAKLRGTEPLTARDVAEIGDLLARHGQPNPAPANIDFWCRPDGVACTRADDGTLQLTACIGGGGGDRNLVARISIASDRDPLQPQQLRRISDLAFDNAADMEAKLADCLQAAAAANTTPLLPVAVDYDASPCEHIVSLKLSLLDAIHAMYIRALAIMPRGAPSGRLLRAVLVAGHCYGPMDPVSNIVLSSVWYHVAFPPPAAQDEGLLDGVLDTKAMARMGLRSLNGLVAILRDTGRSEHEALEYLNACACDLSASYLLEDHPYAAAARAARHPQHAAFGAFLASLSQEKITRLRCLLAAAGGISDAQWEQLNAMIREESGAEGSAASASALPSCPAPFASPWNLPFSTPSPSPRRPPAASLFASLGPFEKRPTLGDKLTFLRTELKKLLHKYCYQHPWEPSYQLDIICGVCESKSCFTTPTFYHANFLASTDGSPRERTLFFAELFEPSPSEANDRFRFGKASQSSCCPVYDYRASTGRCSICENDAKIVHPPSGGHSGEVHGINDLHRSAVDNMETLLRSECSPLSDFRDVEVPNTLNSLRNYQGNENGEQGRSFIGISPSCYMQSFS